LFKSDKLLVASKAPDKDAYAANQKEPSYTFILLVVVLKYKAPETKALPSLSNVGSDVLVPKYLSSKLSKAAKAASRAAAEAVAEDAEEVAELAEFVAEVAAFVAEFDALVAEVDAADAEEEALEA
jgi:hypothetical protein